MCIKAPYLPWHQDHKKYHQLPERNGLITPGPRLGLTSKWIVSSRIILMYQFGDNRIYILHVWYILVSYGWRPSDVDTLSMYYWTERDGGTRSQYIRVYMTEVIRRDILDPHIRLITLLPQPGAPLSLTPYNILVNICPEFLKLNI